MQPSDLDKIAIAARHGFDVHGGRAFAWPGQREVTANLFYALDEAFAAGVREGRERAAVPLTWPKEKRVERLEDMGSGVLVVGLDSDNDVYVSVLDTKRFSGAEFCNPGGGGGGRSPRTREALIRLMVAIEQDNAERPLPKNFRIGNGSGE